MADEMWDDPTASHGRKTGAKETTTHVSIHTLHLDGLRELYRHFLKLPDGAIVEVLIFYKSVNSKSLFSKSQTVINRKKSNNKC